MVFEGAFEKIFSIIKEEGGSEGGVVVQVWISDLTLKSKMFFCGVIKVGELR